MTPRKRIEALERKVKATQPERDFDRERRLRVALIGRPDLLDLRYEIAMAEDAGDTDRAAAMQRKSDEEFGRFLVAFDSDGATVAPDHAPPIVPASPTL